MNITSTASAVLLLTAAVLGAACATGGPATLPTPVIPTATVTPPARGSTPIVPGGVATATPPAGSPTTLPSPTRAASTTSSTGRLSVDDVARALTSGKVTATQTKLSVSCGSGPASSGQIWRASVQGDEQQFVLWEYPDRASLDVDWVADIGKAPQPRREGCVSGGSGYWNENLVMYIQGRDVGTLTATIRNAFLSLGN